MTSPWNIEKKYTTVFRRILKYNVTRYDATLIFAAFHVFKLYHCCSIFSTLRLITYCSLCLNNSLYPARPHSVIVYEYPAPTPSFRFVFTRASLGSIYWFITTGLSRKRHTHENRSHVFAHTYHAKHVCYIVLFTSLQTMYFINCA